VGDRVPAGLHIYPLCRPVSSKPEKPGLKAVTLALFGIETLFGIEMLWLEFLSLFLSCFSL
jgi:hypothetical protein